MAKKDEIKAFSVRRTVTTASNKTFFKGPAHVDGKTAAEIEKAIKAAQKLPESPSPTDNAPEGQDEGDGAEGQDQGDGEPIE